MKTRMLLLFCCLMLRLSGSAQSSLTNLNPIDLSVHAVDRAIPASSYLLLNPALTGLRPVPPASSPFAPFQWTPLPNKFPASGWFYPQSSSPSSLELLARHTNAIDMLNPPARPVPGPVAGRSNLFFRPNLRLSPHLRRKSPTRLKSGKARPRTVLPTAR